MLILRDSSLGGHGLANLPIMGSILDSSCLGQEKCKTDETEHVVESGTKGGMKLF